ncbi:MAG: hypothetical protein BWY11_01956 [Firmicutes bacterium ADurb.Bin182]|nr:MAG: hypothetical protein BWY11_01956 [Firmicutes bacterium ADurb.Bin182]
MEVFVIAAIYICIIVFDFIPLIRMRQKKEARIYLLLLIISLGIILLPNFVDVPSAADLMKSIVGSIIKIPQ